MPHLASSPRQEPELRLPGPIAGTSRVVVDLFYLGIKAGSHRSGRDVVQRLREEAAGRSSTRAR